MPIRPTRIITAFGCRFSVVCPRCERRAVLIYRDESDSSLSCPHCEFTRQLTGEIHLSEVWRRIGIALVPAPVGHGGRAVSLCIATSEDVPQEDRVPCLQLWLQAPCDGENLWFLNEEHLEFVESCLRDSPAFLHRSLQSESGRRKSRWLERWIEEAQNKAPIASCLRELKLKIRPVIDE